MTKEEAIKLIDDRMCFGRGKWTDRHMPEIDVYWQAGRMAIKALEQPERKTGKWIPYDVTNRNMTNTFQCSNCNRYIYLPILIYADEMEYNFCPNCGSYNGGEKYD